MVAFFVNMEWSGRQQIQFLLQSFMLGGLLGLCLDIATGLFTARKRRRWLWSDVLFGPFAAVITFLGALIIMDGQLHPLLFIGVALGMLTEHVTVGGHLCRGVRDIRLWVGKCARKGCYYGSVLAMLCYRKLVLLFCRSKKHRNSEKIS